MKSIKQISEKYNLSSNIVAKRAVLLKCYPVKKIWRANYYSNEDIFRIISYDRSDIISNKKKILIVEYYLLFNHLSLVEISNILNINSDLIKSVITEYERNQCIIIQSKL